MHQQQPTSEQDPSKRLIQSIRCSCKNIFLIFYFKKIKESTLKPLKWLLIIVVFTALTLLATYLLAVPSGQEFSASLIPRYILSFVFISFLPGYCLVNILFVGKNQLDIVEEIVLSVALSFALAGLMGLFLGLSPIGINLNSIAVSLSILVLTLSVVAFVRKTKSLGKLDVHSP
ncbi:MAG: DUF1616 domain-containing protein [Candidatus Bathyarchaeota archaeon]|nr:DUF1616 domain-containing protein [Candidatus Bathyarchaeota archaeon]